MKEVTIIIPVYNRATYLPRLFDSLRRLTYQSVRLILVDNGSEDASLTLCQRFAEEAPFPVEVMQESRRGASAARNHGLSLCTTEWVYFFDSDDEVSADFLDCLMPLTEEEGVDIVAFNTMMEVDGHCRQRTFIPDASPASHILSLTLSTQTMLLRTDFVRQCGGWDESLSTWDDWELAARLLLHHPHIQWFTERSFHRIYVHEESQTGDSFTATLPAILQALTVVDGELTNERDRRALFLRCRIVEGQLRREGTHARLPFGSASFYIKCVGFFLRLYAAMGGRGAWRLALSNF